MRLSANSLMARPFEPTMTDGPVKRSITIAGHRTSLSLEEEFWTALKAIATLDNKSTAELIAAIDATRGDRNLSSAVRVFILNRFENGEAGR